MSMIPSLNPPNGNGSQPKTAEIAPEKFKHNLIDTQKIPITDIITSIRGTPITTVYYAQVLGQTQQALTYQDKTLDVYQQYTKINNLVMAVQTDLQLSQDTETAEFTVTGTAITYPKFTPTKFDHFFAPIRNGEMGLFVVTSVTRKSIYAESAYEIDYELVDRVTVDLAAIFEDRVVKELYFNMELLRDNAEPFLTSDENNDYKVLKQQFVAIGERLHHEYYDRFINNYQVPDQSNLRIIDPFHLEFYQMLYGHLSSQGKNDLTYYRTETLTGGDSFTIWNLLSRRTTVGHDMIEKKLLPLTKLAWGRYTQFGSVYYSHLNSVVWPVDDAILAEIGSDAGLQRGGCGCSHTGDSGFYTAFLEPDEVFAAPTTTFYNGSEEIDYQGNTITPYLTAEDSEIYSGAVKEVIDPDNPGVTIEVPYVHRITVDDNYIFTQAFYDSLPGDVVDGCSVLELLVLNYLKGYPTNIEDLLALINDIPNWTGVQQFYFLPVLGILIKATLGDM